MSSTLSHLSESGKLFIKKKTSLTETVIEHFSTLRFPVHETRGKCIGNCSTAPRTVQAI